MTARPLRIWILSQPFEVRWEDAPGKRLHEDSEDYWALGSTVVAEQLLVIRSLQAEHQLRDTVLHEVIHAIIKMTSHSDRFKGDEKHPEEPVVAVVATTLLAVLRENPNLVMWLMDRVPDPAPSSENVVPAATPHREAG